MLKERISKADGKVKYLSHDIENELIHLIKTGGKNILNYMKKASCCSMNLDTIPYITCVDQLSIVLQCVKIIIDEGGKPTNLM